MIAWETCVFALLTDMPPASNALSKVRMWGKSVERPMIVLHTRPVHAVVIALLTDMPPACLLCADVERIC